MTALEALNIFGVLCTFWAAWFAWYVFSWQARHFEAEFMATWFAVIDPLKQHQSPFNRRYLLAVIDYYLWSRKYAFRLRPSTNGVIAAMFGHAVAMRKLLDEARGDLGIPERDVAFFFAALAEKIRFSPRPHYGDPYGRKMVAQFKSHLDNLTQPEAVRLHRWATDCSIAYREMELLTRVLFDDDRIPRRMHAPLFQPTLLEWTTHVSGGQLGRLILRAQRRWNDFVRQLPLRASEEWTKAQHRLAKESRHCRADR